MSLARTAIAVAAASSRMVALSLTATGGSSTGVTVMLRAAVPVAPPTSVALNVTVRAAATGLSLLLM